MNRKIKFILAGGILGAIWGGISYLAGYLPLPNIINFLLGIPLLISALILKYILQQENYFFLFLLPIPIGISFGLILSLLFYMVFGRRDGRRS